MYSELLKDIKGLNKFEPYAAISDRSAWASLDEKWKSEAVRLGEKHLGFAYPYILATDFLEFSRTGNRVCYEDKLFSKRRALSALVLAECVEDSGRFLDDIVNGIFSICEESAWQLPAHNSYERDSAQLPLPDIERPVLDLFACETGAVLATAEYLLCSRLDKVSPFVRKRIHHELKVRIFEPYLNSHFWWMGNGKEPMNNWTIWCTQNVLLSVFLSDLPMENEEGEAFRHSVIRKACESVDYFLAEYGDDGCCDEGAQYYRHAGLCLFNVTEVLTAVCGGAFDDIYHEEKVKNIASYIFNAHIGGKYYVNFADCSPVAGRAGTREFLFALRTGNEQMAGFAAVDFCDGLPDTLLLENENNLYYRLQNAFTIRRIMNRADAFSRSMLVHPDIYYPSVGLFIARDETMCLAVKAGDNGDSHNHNDTGSFTVYKNSQPMFIDLGVESYTKKTFSSQRYEIWTMQSDYHNLPTINGFMQKDGVEYGASEVRWNLPGKRDSGHEDWICSDVCEIEMNIAGAYPPECRIRSYLRRASLVRGRGILIEDTFDPGEAATTQDGIILNFMTCEKPVPKTTLKGIAFEIGGLGHMHIDGASLLAIETLPIEDARLKTAWEHEVYRIRVRADGCSARMHIS